MMKYHYTYRITNKLLNKHYIGVRTCKYHPKNDIGVKYFSSSLDKDFIKDQKEHPENYKYKIIQIFLSRKEAIKLEIILHNMFNDSVNESFYNRAKQTSVGFDTTGRNDLGQANFGEKNGMYGKTHSYETRKKISEQTKIGMSKRLDKPWAKEMSNETKEKISKSISEKRWVNKNGKNSYIHVSELDRYLQNGWIRGQIKSNTVNMKGKLHSKEKIKKSKKENLTAEVRKRLTEGKKKMYNVLI